MSKSKAELLVPAGSVDSFRAAVRGGADAVYLGLKQFNARARANNFGEEQLPAVMQEARNHGVKVYITLNTVVKNKEIPTLLDFLAYLAKVGADAVIVQDWGVFSLVQRHFPELTVHASTQMGTHNSAGIRFAAQQGIKRVVLARELTPAEIGTMAQNPACELEVFIHGALCYSFSGQCFFSSYIGGRGANRGLCSQPCRMVYSDKNQQKYLFNLKDNQQLENLDQLTRQGIHSLKIEGRMKSADYVFQVASAYRLALDHPEQRDQAARMLQLDFGRPKTVYFLGKDVSDAIADSSNTGIRLGEVVGGGKREFTFFSPHELKNNDRIRVRHVKTNRTSSIKLEDIWVENGRYTVAYSGEEPVKPGDEVYWIGRREQSFPSRLPKVPAPVVRLSVQQKQQIVNWLQTAGQGASREQLFLRIDHSGWFQFIRPEETEQIILSFTRSQWDDFNFDQKFVQKQAARLAIELPKFIAEAHLDFWQKLAQSAFDKEIKTFYISHLSQKLLLPIGATICCNEQVYVYNDAASHYLKSQQIGHFCYAIENDFDNLSSLKNKQGIVLMHTLPELFYSRMPVKLENEENRFNDEFNKTYTKLTRDGISVVIPDRPVNLFQYKKQLLQSGFSRFLFDLKHQSPDPKLIKKLFLGYKAGEPVQPSTTFNFKKGLL